MKFVGVIIGGLISLIGLILLIRNLWHSYRLKRQAQEGVWDEEDYYAEDDIVVLKHDDDDLPDEDPAFQELGFHHNHKATEKPISAAQVTRRNKLRQDILVLNVLAKQGQRFPGYELLQALTSGGLQYGDMNIFHYYQKSKKIGGKAKILFSVASATEPGTLEIEKLGGQRYAGICLFMQISDNDDTLDHFELFIATALQLAEDLDGVLLDDQRQTLNEQNLNQYRKRVLVLKEQAFH